MRLSQRHLTCEVLLPIICTQLAMAIEFTNHKWKGVKAGEPYEIRWRNADEQRVTLLFRRLSPESTPPDAKGERLRLAENLHGDDELYTWNVPTSSILKEGSGDEQRYYDIWILDADGRFQDSSWPFQVEGWNISERGASTSTTTTTPVSVTPFLSANETPSPLISKEPEPSSYSKEDETDPSKAIPIGLVLPAALGLVSGLIGYWLYRKSKQRAMANKQKGSGGPVAAKSPDPETGSLESSVDGKTEPAEIDGNPVWEIHSPRPAYELNAEKIAELSAAAENLRYGPDDDKRPGSKGGGGPH